MKSEAKTLMRDHSRKIAAAFLLLACVPAVAQSLALVDNHGSSYVPVRFLPDDLQQSVAVDTPGYTTLQGVGCLQLSAYAPHLARTIHRLSRQLSPRAV